MQYELFEKNVLFNNNDTQLRRERQLHVTDDSSHRNTSW